MWLSCKGKDQDDEVNIDGFNYYPAQGFPIYYFPYRNQPGYMAPFIAVQILNPRSKCHAVFLS